MIIAPCGFNIERSVKEIDKLEIHEGWKNLQAVENKEVYICDSNLFTCPSARLVDGIELLASLFHPEIFPLQKKFAEKYIPYHKENKVHSG